MKIGIVNIGDELLSGKILNSNQFDLSRMLAPLGHEIPFGLVIGDDSRALAGALSWALGGQGHTGVDILILTGGLGPTRDDLTREAVAAFLGRKVGEDPGALAWLGSFLGTEPADLPAGQRIQAAVPEGTEALRNPVGTACGFRFLFGSTRVYAFPGVPSELKAMAAMHLLPDLPQERVLLEKGLWTFGWSESSQSRAFAGLGLAEPFRFSSLPSENGVRLSLTCLAPVIERAAREIQLDTHWQALIAAIPPEAVVDREGASLPATILKILSDRRATVSVAESCTGGGLGSLLTELPGSSRIFHRGYLTYSNQAKTDLLGVDPAILEEYGAVSEETVLAMVRGCLERSGADYALAITGIAGPEGGSQEKPVGTVWIAVAAKRMAGSQEHTVARRFQFRGDRTQVRSRSCYSALNLLRLLISGNLP